MLVRMSCQQRRTIHGGKDLTVAKELERPKDIFEHHVLVADFTHDSCRVGPAFDPTPPSRLLVLSAPELAARCRDVGECDICDGPMPDSTDGKTVPAVANKATHDGVSAAAKDISWVFVTKVAAHVADLSRDPLPCWHERHAIVTVVDHRILH